MKHYLITIIILLAAWQGAAAQPTGPEIVWSLHVYNSLCAQFTSDDKYIVANKADINPGTDTLLIIETSTGKVIGQCNVPFVIMTIRLTENDSLIYCTGWGGHIGVYNFNDLKFIKKIEKVYDLYWKQTFDIGSIDYFDLSKDNSYIIANWNNRAICIYDIKNDTIKYFTEYIQNPNYHKVKYFKNDQYIAVAYSAGINIYDSQLNYIRRIDLNGHSEFIQDFDISPDETRMVTCANDGKIIIWDLKTWEKIDEVLFDDKDLRQVKFLFPNNMVFYGGGGPLRSSIFDFNKKEQIYRNKLMNSFNGIELSYNNKLILSIEGGSYILIDADKATYINDLYNFDKLLYPNPTDTNIKVDLIINVPSKTFYVISDNSGNTIKQGSLGYLEVGNQQVEINISYLIPGMYFLKIFTDKDDYIFKFMVGR